MAGEWSVRREGDCVIGERVGTRAFVDGIAEVVRGRFDCAEYPQEPLPRADWEVLTRAGVLLPALPREYGGRDSHVELVGVLEAIAEWNLPLAMYTKIVSAVGLRPIVRRGSEETKREVLPAFGAGEPLVCGFASTEPGCGSAMSMMGSRFRRRGDRYRLNGQKHWQGFSATADWWVLSAKNADGPDYGYFVVHRDEGFATVERYDPIGMRLIDYGRNHVDATVPAHRRLDADGATLLPMAELLAPPRSIMAALASGFLRRVDREAREYAAWRRLGRGVLADLGFVRHRLRAIAASAVICRALTHHLLTALDVRGDLTASVPVSLVLKTVASERMVRAADHYLQLVGGEGYRHGSPTNVASQAFLDSRVFTVFDGTNDLLSQQLTQHCLRAAPDTPLTTYLSTWDLTAPALAAGLDLTFLDAPTTHEHLVLAGRAIAYAATHTLVTRWATDTGTTTAESTHLALAALAADIDTVAVEYRLATRFADRA